MLMTSSTQNFNPPLGGKRLETPQATCQPNRREYSLLFFVR